MPATPAWLGAAEALLNRYIDASAQATVLAQRLHGKALQINIEGLGRIQAGVNHGRLALTKEGDPGAAPAPTGPRDTFAADALISGSPPALLQLFQGGVNRDSNRPAPQIRGDAEIAAQFRELFLLARPDLEEELARFVGDFPARRIAEIAQGLRSFAHRLRRTAGENIAEYLQEESRDLVNKTELDEFLHGVDDLRDTSDRIDARIAHLEQRLKGGS